jgi:pimeloyl-ACP methyl ester carboxylesterase
MGSTSMQTVMLHGQRLSFVDSGTGPVLLFVHGLLGSHRNWAHLIDRLDDSHRVIVPDLFGHGTSAKPMGDYSLGAHAATLRDLLDRLGIDRATIVGHSLGGGISMEFCYLFPDRVERLVLVSTGGLGREVSPVLRSATLPGAEWVLPVIASTWVHDRGEFIGRVLHKVGWRPSSDVTAAWQGFTSLSDADGRRAFLATTRAVVDPGGQTVNASDYLAETIAIPTLVVWGGRDRMIPVQHAEHARASIPGCRVEIFEQSGHFPHLDEPDRFAAVLRSFVAESGS